MQTANPSPFGERIVESLYVDTMVLADDVKSYFDMSGRTETSHLAQHARSLVAVESLRATTRLMHVIAWLLSRRAVMRGEISTEAGASRAHRLGPSPSTDAAVLARLPFAAGALVTATMDLHARVAALEAMMLSQAPCRDPVGDMMDALHGAFDVAA